LPDWTRESYGRHKHADRLAAVSEALHVVGWSRDELRVSLRLTFDPVVNDPVVIPDTMRPWEPWPANLAARLFLVKLRALQDEIRCPTIVHAVKAALVHGGGCLDSFRARRPGGLPVPDTWVSAEAADGSGHCAGLVIDGVWDAQAGWDLDGDFTIFTTTHNARGECLRVRGGHGYVDCL
jgi:hypothetical protein